jgi:anti-sigma28 factor (negative regulator of flagellin synthesis)
MKLQLNTSIATPTISGGTPVGKSPEAPAGTGDGIRISIASAALTQLSADRNTKIERVTAAVQGGSYRVSSSETGSAIIEDALSAPN